MRRLLLSISFLLLVGGLLFLRSYRFEQVAGVPQIDLGDLQKSMPILPRGGAWIGDREHPELRLVVESADKPISLRLRIPGIAAVEALHIRFKMSARDIRIGRNLWDDGRLLVQWLAPDGHSAQETDPVCSVRNNEASGEISLVVRPSSGSAVPVLCIQHLGSGGCLQLSQLEIKQVKPRAWWYWGRWGLLILWLGWWVGFLSDRSRVSFWRRIIAAAVWITLAVNVAFPGPWKTLRPFVIPYDFGVVEEQVVEMGKSAFKKDGSVTGGSVLPPTHEKHEIHGKIPPQGGWLIQTKMHLAKLRPLLHALLLFAPTFLLLCLVRQKQALIMGWGLAIAIEASQTAFGYGFGWDDILDLISDAAGIVAALWVYRVAQRKILRKKEIG